MIKVREKNYVISKFVFFYSLEKELTYLRNENRKTTLAAIFIFTLVVLFYVFFISSPKPSPKNQ